MRALGLGFGIALLALAGCAPLASAPAPAPARRSTHGAMAIAQATHEYPSPSVRERAGGPPASGPVAAIRVFARSYINWNAASVSADMQALAARSVGQARSAMQLAAAQAAQDYELQRGGVTNQGTVEAIAPLADRPGQYAVVTRERTTATATSAYQGLAPAWHVAIATVSPQPGGGWAVSGWQPQS